MLSRHFVQSSKIIVLWCVLVPTRACVPLSEHCFSPIIRALCIIIHNVMYCTCVVWNVVDFIYNVCAFRVLLLLCKCAVIATTPSLLELCVVN